MSRNSTEQQHNSTKIGKLTISDVSSHYPKQWVALAISKRDDYGWPVEGKVLIHSANKKDV